MRSLAAAMLCCLLLICPQAGPAHACTSFCLDTPDGPVFATNCDLFIAADGLVFVNRREIAKEGFRASTTGETAKWVSKYGSVTFNLVGREFAWSGMNEAGLVVSTMELKASELPKPDERPPFGSGDWVQYMLDTCGSVQEAIQMHSFVRLIDDADSPGHFLVADAEGNCAAFEYLDGEFVCYTGESLPVKAMSNMRYARALAALERGGPRWWWSNPGQSAERFAGAAVRMESFDASRDTCAASYALATLTHVVAAPHTKWNIVYDIEKREVRFRSAASPTVKRLSLHAFDLSCEAPLLMLDVNAELEGNVDQSFTPYDHDVNLEVFSTFCDRWGIEVSAEGAVELMRFFESFECAR
jgi:choloylglycine hydrolase